MKLFAGYDGGGTKTACVLTDETGRILGSGVGGPSNYLFCGREAAAQSVRAATEQAENFADLPILEAQDYHEAVAMADQAACEGDVVILSPASTSFDRFANFMERGRVFKEIVNSLN